MARPSELRKRLLDYALGLPEAYLDHPWGEDVAKVRKKVFVFFGMPEGEAGMSVKLPYSNAMALSQPGVTPTGYGLGDSGWVSVTFKAGMPLEMLSDWIDESYRTVAPKKLANGLATRLDQMWNSME
jgi:predicted DNA-binding protein (MmcQ/YjbR family)